MNPRKPTVRQLALLDKFGLKDWVKTKAQACGMIDFLIRYPDGGSMGHQANIVHSVLSRQIGRRVLGSNSEGVITHIA